MIDIILPVPKANADLVGGFVEALLDSTEAAVRVIAVLDGGTQKEIGEVQVGLSAVDNVLMHNPIPLYLNACIGDARREIRQQFVVIARPEVRLRDKKWVAKIMRILQVDPVACVIDTLPNTTNSSIAPVKRQLHKAPDDGVRFAVVQGRFFKATLLGNTTDPIKHLAGVALRTGCSVWHHGGVNYNLTEHKEHLIWREPSAVADLSRSPSQTTPASSTPTTTGKGGPTAFDL